MIIKLCNCGRRPKTHGIYTRNKVGYVAIECPACNKHTHCYVGTTCDQAVAEWNDWLADASADEVQKSHEQDLRDSAIHMQRYFEQIAGKGKHL